MITEFKLFENTENTLNSKNQKIYLTNKGIENFWKWFDGSKVVDKDGKPLDFSKNKISINEHYNKI
jgi:hypothetical protein